MFFIFQEWVLLIQANIDLFYGATIEYNNRLPFFIFVFPSIQIVEGVMRWQCEPLNLILICAKLFHDSVFSWLCWIKLEYRPTILHYFVWFEFKWKVWDYDIVIGNWKVVKHSHAFNLYIHLVYNFSVFIEQSVMNNWLLHIVPKTTEFTCVGIYLRMSRNVVLELPMKVIMANRRDIKTLLSWIGSNLERQITLN